MCDLLNKSYTCKEIKKNDITDKDKILRLSKPSINFEVNIKDIYFDLEDLKKNNTKLEGKILNEFLTPDEISNMQENKELIKLIKEVFYIKSFTYEGKEYHYIDKKILNYLEKNNHQEQIVLYSSIDGVLESSIQIFFENIFTIDMLKIISGYYDNGDTWGEVKKFNKYPYTLFFHKIRYEGEWKDHIMLSNHAHGDLDSELINTLFLIINNFNDNEIIQSYFNLEEINDTVDIPEKYALLKNFDFYKVNSSGRELIKYKYNHINIPIIKTF